MGGGEGEEEEGEVLGHVHVELAGFLVEYWEGHVLVGHICVFKGWSGDLGGGEMGRIGKGDERVEIENDGKWGIGGGERGGGCTGAVDLHANGRREDFVPAVDTGDDSAAVDRSANVGNWDRSEGWHAAERVGEGSIGREVGIEGLHLLGWRSGTELGDHMVDFLHCS